MSADHAPIHAPPDPDVYHAGRARWLVERYASGEPGTTLSALHRSDPGTVPSPLAVRRWRRDFPAFDAAMIEAEAVRADALMEQTLEVGDRADVNAAVSKNGIAARWRMAEALAPDRYKGRGGVEVTLNVQLTDAQLYAIAAGADPAGLLAPTAPPLREIAGFTGGSEVGPAPHASGPLVIQPPIEPIRVTDEALHRHMTDHEKNSKNFAEFRADAVDAEPAGE